MITEKEIEMAIDTTQIPMDENGLRRASKQELRQVVRAYRFLLLSLDVSEEKLTEVETEAVKIGRTNRV